MLYEYRMALSMKSQAHWSFAQKHSSTMMIVTVLILLYKTEKVLKQKFKNEE